MVAEDVRYLILVVSPEDSDLIEISRIRPRDGHTMASGEIIYEGMVGNRVLSAVVMERVLGGPIPDGYLVDHIDDNPLNNRRDNLRLATPLQNSGRMRSTRGRSRYKGVSYESRRDRGRGSSPWRAQISLAGLDGTYLRMSVGYYSTQREAARAYDNIAREWYGEYARINLD